MKYLSFMTENCKQTAQKHGLLNDVKILFNKIEKDQSVQVWDSFIPTPYIKKDLGKSFRLVCSKHLIEEENIIIISFLSCFPRGGSGIYDKFINFPDQVCGKYLPEKKDLLDYIKKRKDPLPEPLPELSESEHHFLYDKIEEGNNFDVIVHESSDWVESMKNPNILEMNTRLYDLMIDILARKIINDNEFKADSKSGISLLYKYIPSKKILFLIYPIIKDNYNLICDLEKKYKDIFNQDNSSDVSILRKSRRSYPSYILADEQLWKAIQKNDVGNMALSPEELQILDGITKGTNDVMFPLFINGRPGSGKSTILQYLFASYLFMYQRKELDSRLPNPPLYLTYSEKLLDSAIKNINEILKCNSKIAIYNIDKLSSNGAISCYGIFHKFLLELLPSETRENFSLERKINFPRFRHLWDERREKIPASEIRKLSPELSWHVLRSYIKGMRYDAVSHFSEESYSELPENQQTVQIKTFKQVYDHVWEGWYKPFCEKNNYWDDQDLVFAVLNEEHIDLARYPAIFCDEAQDFSKLELDLILRLSLYSKRSMASYELKRVPFVFAGDPFQTLNPTGFEWEALQANFHEKIVCGLDKASNAKLEFNYQELSYNYRSGKSIVGLCNLIQLVRGILFNQNDLRPQHNWFEEDSNMPVFFNVRDPLCEQKLRDQAELVIILPCQEGEEEEYVKNDDFLHRLASSEKNMRNFLSPMRAKGLEFSRVVLYKFGNTCHKHYPYLFAPLSNGKFHHENKDESLPLKYFMNRLYVGASRAKNRLIIVDDDEGIETLWNNEAIKALEKLLKIYRNSSRFGWTIETINYVHKGVEDNWTQDRDDPFMLAEEFHNSGISENDPYKLRLAEANYVRCGQPVNAKLCKAQRLEMENQLSKAGDLYIELDKIEKALECYWSNGDFVKIGKSHKFNNTPEQRAAIYHLGEHSYAESERFFDFLVEQIKGPIRSKISSDHRWQKILDECLDSILKHVNERDFDKLYRQMRELENNGISPSDNCKYAELASRAQDYQYAVALWESKNLSPTTNKNYCVAKANTLPYPSNLKWLDKINYDTEIINQWNINQNAFLDNKDIKIVFESLLKQNQYDNIIKLLISHPDEECLWKSHNIFKSNSFELYKNIISHLLIKLSANNGNWKDIKKIFNDKNLSKTSLRHLSKVLAHEVAQSKKFPQSTIENKNAIAVILKNLFIDADWEEIVSLRVAGAAIESAYKIIDALEFYEGVWKKGKISANKDDSEYAIKRWVKSKLRFAELLEQEGNLKAAGKHRIEAENICRSRLGINKDNIPDNPEFDEIDIPIPTFTSTNIDSASPGDKAMILKLYKDKKKTPEEIAEFLNEDISLVKLIILEDRKRI